MSWEVLAKAAAANNAPKPFTFGQVTPTQAGATPSLMQYLSEAQAKTQPAPAPAIPKLGAAPVQSTAFNPYEATGEYLAKYGDKIDPLDYMTAQGLSKSGPAAIPVVGKAPTTDIASLYDTVRKSVENAYTGGVGLNGPTGINGRYGAKLSEQQFAEAIANQNKAKAKRLGSLAAVDYGTLGAKTYQDYLAKWGGAKDQLSGTAKTTNALYSALDAQGKSYGFDWNTKTDGNEQFTAANFLAENGVSDLSKLKLDKAKNTLTDTASGKVFKLTPKKEGLQLTYDRGRGGDGFTRILVDQDANGNVVVMPSWAPSKGLGALGAIVPIAASFIPGIGPLGAAALGGLTSAVSGGSISDVLKNAALSGIGSYGAGALGSAIKGSGIASNIGGSLGKAVEGAVRGAGGAAIKGALGGNLDLRNVLAGAVGGGAGAGAADALGGGVAGSLGGTLAGSTLGGVAAGAPLKDALIAGLANTAGKGLGIAAQSGVDALTNVIADRPQPTATPLPSATDEAPTSLLPEGGGLTASAIDNILGGLESSAITPEPSIPDYTPILDVLQPGSMDGASGVVDDFELPDLQIMEPIMTDSIDRDYVFGGSPDIGPNYNFDPVIGNVGTIPGTDFDFGFDDSGLGQAITDAISSGEMGFTSPIGANPVDGVQTGTQTPTGGLGNTLGNALQSGIKAVLESAGTAGKGALTNLLTGGANGGLNTNALLSLLAAYLSYKDAKQPVDTGYNKVMGKASGNTPTQQVTQGKYGPISRVTYAAQGGLMGDQAAAAFAPRFVEGPGDGMSDSIPADLYAAGGQVKPAAIGDGEFIIPADVVSHLGNGSSKAGARQLYDMMDRIRADRTGTDQQAPQVNPGNYLPL